MNFGGIYPAYSLRNALFVVVPVPYDLTPTYQPGSHRGPAAIIEASTNMKLYDEELKKETHMAGIHTTLPVTIDARGPKNMINSNILQSHFKSLRASTMLKDFAKITP